MLLLIIIGFKLFISIYLIKLIDITIYKIILMNDINKALLPIVSIPLFTIYNDEITINIAINMLDVSNKYFTLQKLVKSFSNIVNENIVIIIIINFIVFECIISNKFLLFNDLITNIGINPIIKPINNDIHVVFLLLNNILENPIPL